MIALKTSQKIKLASVLYHVVRAGRAVLGMGDEATVTRRGVTYHLDLSEGIDFAIWLNASFEREMIQSIQQYVPEGSTVLDIGANIGAITLELAKQVGANGRVLAFEPTDFAFQKLQRNVQLNPSLRDQIVLHQAFLGDRADRQDNPSGIYSSWPLVSGSEDLHQKHLGREMPLSGASSLVLDSVLSEAGVTSVTAVKLDVDGFECAVLRGATELLDNSRPVFFIELAPYVHAERGYSFDEYIEHFTKRGYSLVDQRTGKELPANPSAISSSIGDGSSINAIAMP